MSDRDRESLARDVDEESARCHARQLEHAYRHRVQAMEIVEEPTVEFVLAERALDGGKVEHGQLGNGIGTSVRARSVSDGLSYR